MKRIIECVHQITGAALRNVVFAAYRLVQTFRLCVVFYNTRYAVLIILNEIYVLLILVCLRPQLEGSWNNLG